MIVNTLTTKKKAIRFIILLGCISLFADMTYEGARSINGPFLAILGASGTVVGIVAGLGEMLGYGLRLLTGYISDRTHKYWLIMICGYSLNLFSVPLLTWAGYWQVAAILMITERVGKAIRNPTRDAMLSHASKETGRGWGFGLHEFMDQLGATIGPLLMMAVLFYKSGNIRSGYLLLFIPAVCAMIILLLAKHLYPHPYKLEIKTVHLQQSKKYPPQFFVYAFAAMCLATGYADFPLIAFHFKQQNIVATAWIPGLYAIAMFSDGLSALLMGWLFDKFGVWTLVGSTVLSMFFAPMVFLMNIYWAIPGMVLWGIGMGAQESILKAGIADIIPSEKTATAFGLFDTMYGVAWFVGSAIMGYLYDSSVTNLVIFSINMQTFTIIIFMGYAIRNRRMKMRDNR